MLDRSSLIIGLTVAVALGLIGTWAGLSGPTGRRTPQEFIDTDDELLRWVELERVGILTSENFVGHRIRVVEGVLTNLGDRTLLSVELSVTFRSVEGEAVLESIEEALRTPLGPGARRLYEFRFENLSPQWNFRVPDIAVERVGF